MTTNKKTKKIEQDLENGALRDNYVGEFMLAYGKGDYKMAIGQLFDYWFNEKGDVKKHIAILLPMEPPDESIRMLEWVGIGVLWFSGNKIKTNTEWLKCICNE